MGGVVEGRRAGGQGSTPRTTNSSLQSDFIILSQTGKCDHKLYYSIQVGLHNNPWRHYFKEE